MRHQLWLWTLLQYGPPPGTDSDSSKLVNTACSARSQNQPWGNLTNWVFPIPAYTKHSQDDVVVSVLDVDQEDLGFLSHEAFLWPRANHYLSAQLASKEKNHICHLEFLEESYYINMNNKEPICHIKKPICHKILPLTSKSLQISRNNQFSSHVQECNRLNKVTVIHNQDHPIKCSHNWNITCFLCYFWLTKDIQKKTQWNL